MTEIRIDHGLLGFSMGTKAHQANRLASCWEVAAAAAAAAAVVVAANHDLLASNFSPEKQKLFYGVRILLLTSTFSKKSATSISVG